MDDFVPAWVLWLIVLAALSAALHYFVGVEVMNMTWALSSIAVAAILAFVWPKPLSG